VGLPNVGKSTLFNALLKKQQALAANYPFATIEPNVGIVPVPDSRLDSLVSIVKTENKMSNLPPIKPATVEFYDIAGLVKGASEGAGLGNKFLSHIREVSVICHVVRAFEDPDVIKEGAVDPKSDYEVINAELILADLSTAQNVQSKVKRFTKESEKSAIAKLIDGLNAGRPARKISGD
jgi:GTP-binding protein YchF